MTRQGSFKRAVRQRARELGQRYTEALAALEAGKSPDRPVRPFEREALKDHLENHYGIQVASIAPIDDPASRPLGSWEGHYPSTLLVKHRDGRSWVARIFSSPVDKIRRVQEDADILRFLASHNYPAERLAHDDPVSVINGSGLIVTEFVEGGRPTDASGRVELPGVNYELGDLLGRLHALPLEDGAVARDGGSDEHDGGFFVGRPKQDLAAAMSFLASVENLVPEEGQEDFDSLRNRVEQADDGEGLPEALTHGNFHAWAAVGEPGNLAIVGWAGAGRGPRLPALAWLLTTTAEGKDENIKAVMDGYTQHVQLTNEELDRLPGVLNIRPLWLACLDYRMTLRNGQTPNMDAGWLGWRPERGKRLAKLATALLHR